MTTQMRAMSSLTGVIAAIEAHRAEGERERRLPDATLAAMKDADVFSSWASAVYGGDQVDLSVFLRSVEEVARADGASAWNMANLGSGAVLAAFLPENGGREVYAGGSANLAIAGSVIPNGRAVPAEGGFRLSGRWPLASGCENADWLSGVGIVFDGDAPRMTPFGPDLRVMFLRLADVEILDTWDSLGMRGTGSTDIAANDVFVPEDLTFPLFGGQPQVPGDLYKIGILPLFSMSLTAVMLGIGRTAIDEFVALAKQKTPTLSQTGLAVRPTVHAEVARAEALLQSARAYFYEVAAEVMAAAEAGETIPDEVEARRRLAGNNAGASARQVVDSMFALAGATPIYKGNRLEQCLRDIHTATQHLVVSPVWWEKTGQFYFGLGLGTP